MTIVERSHILTPHEPPTSLIICPDHRYDEMQEENRDGEGAALIILRSPENPEILLGLHNSKDSEKHGKWSFFGETRKSGEETGLATLSRGLAEELNIDDLTELELLTYDPEMIFHIVHKLPRRSQYYPGEKSFTVGVYTLWTEKDYSGYVGSNEVIETRHFPLEDILEEKTNLPLREFTLPSLRELSAQGILIPMDAPLKPVRFSI